MTELRAGMVTCEHCAIGAYVKLDQQTAGAINTHAVDMLAGEGVEPGDKTSTKVLQCAAAIAIGACRTYASGSDQLVNRADLRPVDHLEPYQVYPYL